MSQAAACSGELGAQLPKNSSGKIPAAQAPWAGWGCRGVRVAHHLGQERQLWVSGLRSPTPIPHPICPASQMDLEATLSKLASGSPARERNACFRYSCLHLPFLLVSSLPPGRPCGRPHHLWDTPLMCSSHKYLWSIHWGLGSKSHPYAELDLAQILTLKLGISPVQGTAGLRAGPRPPAGLMT